jgi:hypothetical protein
MAADTINSKQLGVISLFMARRDIILINCISGCLPWVTQIPAIPGVSVFVAKIGVNLMVNSDPIVKR